jgi:hypothetical protein
MIIFCHLVDFLCSLGLDCVASSVAKCFAKIFHARKHVKLFIKNHCHHENYHDLNYPIFFIKIYSM